MRFCVRVPVLSVQMTVTAPMVSHACILRTKLLVFSMRRMDMANESVMLMGSPSGTAMTMMATEIMKRWSTCCETASQFCCNSPPKKKALKSMMQKMATASEMPTRPMSRESRASWRLSGVGSSQRTAACSVTRPASVASPTAVTTNRPYPSATVVPRKTRSEG